jgi:hypothetical protein
MIEAPDRALPRLETAEDRGLVLADPSRGSGARDCCFLAVVTLLSSVFYVSRLGFYWDDWFVLRIFHFSTDQSANGVDEGVRNFINSARNPEILNF